MSGAKHWRCFHCDEVFTNPACARLHFGRDDGAEPVCMIRTLGETALLRALRDAEDQLVSYRNEDSNVLRAMAAMQSDYRIALEREEIKGYERGLRDAKQYPETLGLRPAESVS